MKRFFIFIFLLFITCAVFSQAQSSTFLYKAKFEGVNTPEKAAEVMKTLKTVFKTNSTFNESTGLIEFSSNMSINQTAFNHLMAGEGYQLESFEKQEVKPAEVEKAGAPPKK
jgi:hypothetical protein